MTPPTRHVNPGQDTTIDPTFHCDHLRSAPTPTEPSVRGWVPPDEPKASPRDFTFYRITGGIFEPDLVTVKDAPGVVHAFKMLASMGHDPRKYDIMNIGQFSEFPDDYEN